MEDADCKTWFQLIKDTYLKYINTQINIMVMSKFTNSLIEALPNFQELLARKA